MSYAEVGAKPWYQHTLSDGLVVDEAQPGNVFVVGHGRQPTFGRAFGAEGDPVVKEAHGHKYKAVPPGTVALLMALLQDASYAPLPAGTTYLGKPSPEGSIVPVEGKPAPGKSISDWVDARLKEGLGVVGAEGHGSDLGGADGILIPTKAVALASLITMSPENTDKSGVLVEPPGGWPKPGASNGKSSTAMVAAGVGVAALLGVGYYMTTKEKSYARNPEPWQYGLVLAAAGGAAFLGYRAYTNNKAAKACEYTVWQEINGQAVKGTAASIGSAPLYKADADKDDEMRVHFYKMNLDESKNWLLEKTCPDYVTPERLAYRGPARV